MKKYLVILLLVVAGVAAATNQPKTCKGIKVDGKPCMQVIINKEGYCRFHDPSALHCTFIKKDGNRCGMTVKAGVKLCKYHIGK